MKIKRNSPLLLGALLGGLTILPVIALSYLGAKLAALPFVPFDVFDWLARVLPGNVISLGIDTIVRTITGLGLGRISGTAKTIEQGMGVMLVIASGVVLGLVLSWLQGLGRWPGTSIGTALGAVAALIVAGIELMLKSAIASSGMVALVWLAFLFVGWGTLLGKWFNTLVNLPAELAAATPLPPSRRVFLMKVIGGSIGVAVIATGIGKFWQAQSDASGAGQTLASPSGPTPPANSPSALPMPQATADAALRNRLPPAPGTRPELTANVDFYRTDIDTLPLVIDQATWKLRVLGLFDHPRDLTLAELMARPAVTQPMTQGCISNPVGGDLISTSNYVGVRLRDLLSDLGMRPEATALIVKSADDYYESVGMRDLMDPRTLLVYGMNGETLPNVHGFPLRIYIPNRYGMKQPKWITSIEAAKSEGPGYWVDRGWSPTAYPQIVSVIDAIAKDKRENDKVPIGGIAWAGDRGIKKVELQVDGGAWTEVTLLLPSLSPLTWVLWRYDWTPLPGAHTFTVRATDGNGALQIQAVADTAPDGATGYDYLQVTI